MELSILPPQSIPAWRIGCSGFHYPEWKKEFYPEGLPKKNWFEYYSAHFNTIELNVTFYRFPQIATLKNWYGISPAGFSFSVKAPRLITHYKQFKDTGKMLDDFYGSIREGLKEKLGAVLFQLPGRTAYTEDRLQKIAESLNPAFSNVVEFRHESWWNETVYNSLAKHSIAFCGQSHPALPDIVVLNTSVAYYRFHGVPDLYKSQYDPGKIQQVIERITQDSSIQQAYIYFNNTMGLAGINNARQALVIVSNVKRQTSNVKRETSNVKRETSNVKRQT